MRQQSNGGGKWYALYTKPRWEKKVDRLLYEKGYECYCPLNKIYRQWSDRLKIVEEPLFKSYVFVKLNDEQKQNVRMISGVVNFVYWLGKPAVIRQKEIDTIKRFLNDYEYLESKPMEVKLESEVLINSGAFADKKGTVKRVFKKRVEVHIESIGYTLVAYIDKSKISLVNSKKQ